jgi:hypothetical protein
MGVLTVFSHYQTLSRFFNGVGRIFVFVFFRPRRHGRHHVHCRSAPSMSSWLGGGGGPLAAVLMVNNVQDIAHGPLSGIKQFTHGVLVGRHHPARIYFVSLTVPLLKS